MLFDGAAYWTVRVTIVDWVMEPEVALMVIWAAPVGVEGTNTSLVLEQPAIKLRVARINPNRAKSLMACRPAGA